MLEFNPKFRVTASTCLKSSVFDKIRVPDLEQPAPYTISTSHDLSDKFDYDEWHTIGYSPEEIINQIKI
jgi:hypothetical protein